MARFELYRRGRTLLQTQIMIVTIWKYVRGEVG